MLNLFCHSKTEELGAVPVIICKGNKGVAQNLEIPLCNVLAEGLNAKVDLCKALNYQAFRALYISLLVLG